MIQEKRVTGRLVGLWGFCLLCFCTVFCLLTDMPVEATETSGDWEYSISEDGTVEITGYKGEETEVVIPEMISGKSVTKIGTSAFRNCSNIISIEIPNGVTEIGNFAFYGCSSLTSIEIPSGVTEIKRSIFEKCSGLTSITIPSNVTSIKKYAFYGCSSLTSIAIPSGVIEIGESAFEGCSSLGSITIPSGVIEIGESTFEGCNSLSSVTIQNGVTSIGERAFYGCSSLSSITIPTSVMSIGDFAFWTCSSLSSVTILNSMTSIGMCVFISDWLTFYAEPGSYAEEYAKENEFKFICLHHTYKQTTTNVATTKQNGTIVTKCSTCGDIKPTTIVYAASSIELSKTSFTYNGKNRKPTVTIKDSKGNQLPAGSYKITYPKTSKNVGEYTMIVTLQGNYSGTVKLTYQIKPKTTSISKLTAKKKGFTVKWKKQTSQTTGYQLQYSTSSKFKGAKTVTVKKNKTTSKSIAKLKAGKKYYVRIRTYKTVKISEKNVKIVSGWSKVKSVKTKK